MSDPSIPTCTAFVENRLLASGPRDEVAAALWQATSRGLEGQILVFDDHTGRSIDLAQRHAPGPVQEPEQASPAAGPRRPGRPKLGVIAREVTLLPRHWQWLAAQPGGASVALRKLVEAARRHTAASEPERRRLESAYHFITTMAGDLPRYEAATRALFAKDATGFRTQMAGWPGDIQRHALRLAFEGP